MANATNITALIKDLGFEVIINLGTSFEIQHPKNPKFILKAVQVYQKTEVALYSRFKEAEDSEYDEYDFRDDTDTTPEGFNKNQHISIRIDTKDPRFFLAIGGAVIEQFKAISI